MARELTENAEVTALVLNNNEIGHEGGAEIAEALYFLRFLLSIELDDNSIGDVGCSALAANLVKIHFLRRSH
jgi:Leucine Rich repeat